MSPPAVKTALVMAGAGADAVFPASTAAIPAPAGAAAPSRRRPEPAPEFRLVRVNNTTVRPPTLRGAFVPARATTDPVGPVTSAILLRTGGSWAEHHRIDGRRGARAVFVGGRSGRRANLVGRARPRTCTRGWRAQSGRGRNVARASNRQKATGATGSSWDRPDLSVTNGSFRRTDGWRRRALALASPPLIDDRASLQPPTPANDAPRRRTRAPLEVCRPVVRVRRPASARRATAIRHQPATGAGDAGGRS